MKNYTRTLHGNKLTYFIILNCPLSTLWRECRPQLTEKNGEDWTQLFNSAGARAARVDDANFPSAALNTGFHGLTLPIAVFPPNSVATNCSWRLTYDLFKDFPKTVESPDLI